MAPSVTPEFLLLQQALAGRYSLERELGRGGMGIVYLARDVALDRPVAIKLLPPALAGSTERRTRFVREARLAASLSHPHIVPIHAVEERDGLVWFVMAYVDGETLGERVRRAGPLPVSEAGRVLREVAWALGHAHARGIVHRDVKPDNILLERGTGRALVTDFGIAHAGDQTTDPGSQRAGTPHYMSPEQGAGELPDARSDLYSLGVTMYWALTGRLPFEAPTAVALLAQHATAPVPSLGATRAGIPAALRHAVERCLAKSPDERFPSAEALIEAVAEVRDPRGDVPVPVRAFVRDADGAGREMGGALVAAASAQAGSFLIGMGSGVADDIAAAVLTVAAVVTGGYALTRYGMLIASARDLLRGGYDHAGVRVGLELEHRAVEEEEATRPRPPRSETIAIAAIGAAKTALAAWLVGAESPWLYVPGLTGVVTIPAITIRRVWGDLRRGPNRWYRALAGRLGQWTFGIAGIGLRRGVRAQPVAGQSTVVAMGDSIAELFDALPAEHRRAVNDLPKVVERLQSHALSLREHRDAPNAARRLETVVTALESVRLELLRMHAGAGSLDDLTRDLEAARELGHQVDAAIEVRALLRDGPVTPPEEARTPA